MNNIPKNRLFKWIGGKNWLRKTLYDTSSDILQNQKIYIEPFAGGLGSFLAMFPNLENFEKIIINDVNPLIIETYKQIKKNPKQIIAEYIKLENDFYETIPLEAYSYHKTKDKVILKELLYDSSLFFKTIRERFNILKVQKISSETIAIFLFLTEHAFNGIYRENSKGQYNSPFNWDNKKQNTDSKINTIISYHDFFNLVDIKFENMDVFELLEKYDKKDTFIYLDPPYINENKGENKYSKEHFTEKHQLKLLSLILEYDSFIYSNHFHPLIVDFFDNNHISYKKVARKNIMSSSNETRKNDIYEILAFK